MSKSRIITLGACAAAVFAGTAVTFPDAAEAVIVCRGRISGEGSGTGLFGQSTVVARQNAVADWARKAAARDGAVFGNFVGSRRVNYDCRDGAVFQSKCVVTAEPCADVRARARPTKKKRRVARGARRR